MDEISNGERFTIIVAWRFRYYAIIIGDFNFGLCVDYIKPEPIFASGLMTIFPEESDCLTLPERSIEILMDISKSLKGRGYDIHSKQQNLNLSLNLPHSIILADP